MPFSSSDRQAKIDFDHPTDLDWVLKPETERRGSEWPQCDLKSDPRLGFFTFGKGS